MQKVGHLSLDSDNHLDPKEIGRKYFKQAGAELGQAQPKLGIEAGV